MDQNGIQGILVRDSNTAVGPTETDLLVGITPETVNLPTPVLNFGDGLSASYDSTNNKVDVNKADGSTITAGAAIATKAGVACLNGATAQAYTLADPTSGTDDYKELLIIDMTGKAHTVASPTGFNGGSNKTLTWGGTALQSIRLVAKGGHWYVVNANGVTLGA